MATCRLCGKGGWLQSVNANGLCANCQPIVLTVVNSKIRIIQDSIRLVSESKTLSVRLSRCDLILEHTKSLIPYEEKGIPTFEPLPSVMYAKYSGLRDELVVDTLEKEFNACIEKALLSQAASAKVKGITKVQSRLPEYKSKMLDPKRIEPLEFRIAAMLHEAQLSAFLEEAKKAEFKGNKKKALDQYYEALYFLRNDCIKDSDQQERINFLETKVRDMGGKLDSTETPK